MAGNHAIGMNQGMPLDRDEIARRIKAARELRGLDQMALGRLLAGDGLGAHDVGRIERGDMQMSRVQREAITRHLRIPERWLTAESVDEILGLHNGQPSPPAVAPQAVEELRGEVRAVIQAVEELLRRDTGPSS